MEPTEGAARRQDRDSVGGFPAASIETRLRLILDSALDAVVSMDSGGRILDWNKRAEILFGWPSGNVIGRPIADVIIPERFREAHNRGLRRFLQTGEGPILNHRIEMPALRRDGSEFPVELAVAPARTENDWIFTSFIRDITERKALEGRQALQSDAPRILSESSDVEGAVSGLLASFLGRLGWQVAGYWSVGEDGVSLNLVEMQEANPNDLSTFHAVSRSHPLAVGGEIPVEIVSAGRPHWWSAFPWETAPIRGAAAGLSALRSAFGFPVTAGGRIVGVFELHATVVRHEDPALLETLMGIGRQLGQFLEKRRAEVELRMREEQLELIMDATPALISYIGADRRYRFVNSTYENWFGHPKADVIGKSMEEILGQAAFERLRGKVDAVLEGEPQRWEMEVPYKNGPSRYVQAHYLPHRNPDGIVEGFIVLVLDLSERRRMEEKLLEKEGFLESIYNGVEEAIFVVDIPEDGRYVFTGFNPAYLRRSQGWGVDMRDLLGRTTADLRAFFPEDLVASVEAKYAECASSEVPIEFEDTLMIDGSPTYWVTHLSALRDNAGRPYRLVGTSVNITGQKEDSARIRQAEEQLLQSQKMEAVGRLAGGIAHDFNNLLTAINGYASMLSAALPKDGNHSSMAKEIHKAGEKGARLTKQLLAFSRMQAASKELVEPNEVVAGMESLLKRVIGENIELAARYAPDCPLVAIDRIQLEQVILNLAINARDAMPTGGRLLLALSASTGMPAKTGIQQPDAARRELVLTVTDTGLGMNEEVKARIFEPFFTTKEPGTGTGLGLSTVYGIVKQNGGTIEVESSPGKGSTFRLRLPEAPPNTARASDEAPPS